MSEPSGSLIFFCNRTPPLTNLKGQLVSRIRPDVFDECGRSVFENLETMKIYIRQFKSILFLGLVASLSLLAQITGDLQITVSDATNAVIPGATVVVTSSETGTSRTVVTDASGAARVNQL